MWFLCIKDFEKSGADEHQNMENNNFSTLLHVLFLRSRSYNAFVGKPLQLVPKKTCYIKETSRCKVILLYMFLRNSTYYATHRGKTTYLLTREVSNVTAMWHTCHGIACHNGKYRVPEFFIRMEETLEIVRKNMAKVSVHRANHFLRSLLQQALSWKGDAFEFD